MLVTHFNKIQAVLKFIKMLDFDFIFKAVPISLLSVSVYREKENYRYGRSGSNALRIKNKYPFLNKGNVYNLFSISKWFPGSRQCIADTVRVLTYIVLATVVLLNYSTIDHFRICSSCFLQ